MTMESVGTSRQPLMLKEWLELESSAELSRDGFGCYPRHLAAELRSVSGRRRNDDVIARVSAAVRAALLRAPSVRQGDAGALSRSLSRGLRVGFWKKRRAEAEEMDRRVPSCSAAVTSGRRDGSSSPAKSPRRMSWEGRQARVGDACLGSRTSHETEKVAGRECETACHLDEMPEQEQRLSPVSVMDLPGQDEDDGNNEISGNGHSEDYGDDETMSPTFERSMANIRRASQLLLQKIRQFEHLAELDPSDIDAATTATEETSCHLAETDSTEEDGDEGAVQDLLALLQVSSPVAACRYRNLLKDFFRDGLSSDSPNTAELLLATARSWLDGRHCTLRSDGKAEVEEMERLGRWKCFREDEQEHLTFGVESGIFWSLMEELVDDLC